MVTPLILIPSMASSFSTGEHNPIYHYPTIGGRSTAQPLDVQLPTLSGIIIPPLSGFAHLLSSRSYQSSKKQLAKPQLDRIDTKCTEVEPPFTQRIVPYSSSPSPTFAASSLTGSMMSAMGVQPPSSSFSEFDSREEKNSAISTFEINIPHTSRKEDDSVFDLPRTSHSQRTIPPGSIEDDDADAEDAWNLVPYNIAWGPSYYGYKKGTLPGPDGKCIFLRSPTPLKNQRTGQACEKCRERKAKCSGSRPSCARCIARGHTCEYGPEIKKTKHSDDEDSDSGGDDGDDDDDDDSDQQGDIDVHMSSPPSSVAKTLLARRPTTTVRRRRNTESGAFPARSTSRRPSARRHSILNPSRDAISPIAMKRRVASQSPQQKCSPTSEEHYLRTPDGSCMPSPFSDSSDAGSFFSLPSYPNSAMSSPLTPLGASQEPLGGGSYLTVPSFGGNFVTAMDVDIPTSQDLSYLDTQSLRVVDASQFAYDSRTGDATFYVPHTMPFSDDTKISGSSIVIGNYANHTRYVDGSLLNLHSFDSNFSGRGLELEGADNHNVNDIPQLQVTDFDSSSAQSNWSSSVMEQPAAGAFDELAFLAQLAQLPATIFDFKQEH